MAETGNAPGLGPFEDPAAPAEASEDRESEQRATASTGEVTAPASSLRQRIVKRTVSHTSAASVEEAGPPPDGGFYAWMQIVMGHLVVMNTWGYISTFGVFQTYYQTLGHPPSDISWIGAMQIFLLFFVGTFSGRALDAGLFRQVFLAGIIFQLVGVFMTSLSTKYWQIFLAQGLCTGIGNGLAFTPVIGLVSTYFSTHKMVAMSAVACGGGTGGMLFPGLVSALLPSIGFGWTVRVLGFIQLVFDIVAFTTLRTRVAPRKAGPIVEFAAFKEATYTLCCIGNFLLYLSLYFAFFYIGSYGRNIIGLSYPTSIHLLIVLNAVGIISRMVPAYIADKYSGPLNVHVPFAFVSGIVVFGWAGVSTEGGLYAFAVFYGLFANSLQSLFPVGLAALTEDLRKVGTRLGMAFTIVSFACLTGPSIGGALIQAADGDYIYAQMWAGACLVAGALVLLAARIAKTGWVLMAKT